MINTLICPTSVQISLLLHSFVTSKIIFFTLGLNSKQRLVLTLIQKKFQDTVETFSLSSHMFGVWFTFIHSEVNFRVFLLFNISFGSVSWHRCCCVYPWKLNLCVGFVEKCWDILITSFLYYRTERASWKINMNVVFQMVMKQCRWY